LDRAAPAYVSAGGENPLFAVQLGDLDHGDPTTLTDMRQMHKDMRDPSKLHGADFVNRILSKRALVHVWDDHDYGGNDEDKNFAGRADAWQAFDEYYPTYARPNAAAGLWHKFTCANAEFFVLDLRSQRDPGTDPDSSLKSMLDGDSIALDQKDWLFDGLKGSTARWKFILSSVTFNEDARPASDDLWHSFSNEAKVIEDWLSKEGIADVIVLSGDIHTGGGIDDGTNSLVSVPEMTVPHTNLADGNRRNLGTWSEGVTAGRPNGAGYGMVTVTATSVTLTAKAENGTVRHSYTI
jgi:alkaline phosphatase D